MTSRIFATFNRLAKEKRKALIPYVMAGDPDIATTQSIMTALVKGGADLIELGIPFSDPMADGPVIQKAADRALAQGVTLAKVLDLVAKFRQTNDATPIVLMGYTNPIEAMGYDIFSKAAASASVDGVLVVDTPVEECEQLHTALAQQGLDMIFLLAPTSPEARWHALLNRAKGYVYYVSLKGVTGSMDIDWVSLAERLPKIKSCLNLPIAIGFGIHDAESAVKAATFSDAVIIGSKLIESLNDGPHSSAPDRGQAFLQQIRTALDRTHFDRAEPFP